MDRDIKECLQKMADLMPLLTRSFEAFGPMDLSICHITMPQLAVLKEIGKASDGKMTDLARAFGIKLSSVTGMVDRLEKEGFVSRTRDPKDRRVVRVHLLKKGSIAAKKMLERKKKNMSLLLKVLSSQERGYLIKIMEKLVLAIPKKVEVKDK